MLTTDSENRLTQLFDRYMHTLQVFVALHVAVLISANSLAKSKYVSMQFETQQKTKSSSNLEVL